jgi:hypothetical protein
MKSKEVVMEMRRRASWTALLRGLMAVALVIAAGRVEAALLFSDAFAYPTGSLAGNGGGTGWFAGSLWTGGTGGNGNQVTGSLPGVYGSSIQISSGAAVTSRSLATTYVSGTTSYYIACVVNANPYQGGQGQYAGASVFLAADPTNSLLVGMPGDSGGLGFDWTFRGAPFQSATNNTNYLTLIGITQGSGTTTTVTMYVSTDLTISGTALAATTPWDSVPNEANFSFDSVSFAGGYTPGSIRIAALAMADTPGEAVAFTQSVVVPEPHALLTAAGVVVGVAAAVRARQRSRQ